MRHSQTMRNYAKAFFAFAALAMVGACADNSAVAPAAKAPVVVAPANFSQIGVPVVFRVNNSEGITKKIGNNVLNIPAGAICDLSSSYGSTEWNKPCTALKGSVVITATVFYDSNDQPYIDFQPAMRFAPNKEVMLFFKSGKNTTGNLLVVKYCNNVGVCVDESLNDASLKPFRIGNSSILGRRVKHFSGYVVGSGDACSGTATPMGDGNYWCEEGNARRSGYMVASGEDVSDLLKDKDKDDKDDDKSSQ